MKEGKGMEMKKICPLMGGNVCKEEMCALWPQVGKVCSLTQIGASLASINGSGLDINASEIEDILKDVSEDVHRIWKDM